MPTFVAPDTTTCRISVDGGQLPQSTELLLIETTVQSNLRGPDVATLVFIDDRNAIADDSKFAIGAALKVTVVQTEGTTIYDGEITELESAFEERGFTVVVRAMDKTHRLLRGRKVEAFLNQSYANIVSNLALQVGVQATVGEDNVRRPHTLRLNETPWEFINRLAQEVGWVVGSEEGKLTFRPPPQVSAAPRPGTVSQVNTTQLVAGENLLEARVVVTAAGQVAKVRTRGWDPLNKRAVVAEVEAETIAAKTPLGAPKALSQKFGTAEDLVVATPYTTQAEASAAAQGRAERVASAHTELVGVAVGDPKLMAGVAVSIGNLGKRFEGSYVLTEVRHSISTDGYRCEIAATGAREHSLLGAGGGAGEDVRWRVPGVAPAVVTNLNDPDQLGRIRVKLPWLDDNVETGWIRVAHMAASNGYGGLFMPEVGDEVLVGFDRGDLNHGYVIGHLYNGNDKPGKDWPDTIKNGKSVTRRLTSRTRQGLVFFDDDSKKGLRVRTGDEKNWIDLNESKTLIDVNSEGKVSILAGGDITIEAQGNMTLKAANKLSLTGEMGVSIQGQSFEAKAKLGATVDAGTGALSLKGMSGEMATNTTCTVKSTGILTVQGSLVKIN